MSSYAALNSNNRRYIANRPCPEMRGQDQQPRSPSVCDQLIFMSARSSNTMAVSRTLVAALLCCLGLDVRAQPIEVRVEMRGEQVVVDVQAMVAAKPADAWSVLTDYEHMARFVSALKSSAVVSRKGNASKLSRRARPKSVS